MPSTFRLAPIPRWVVLNDAGLPASGAVMYCRSSLNHNNIKNVFKDPAATIPWPLNQDGGIVFEGNGTPAGAFYWEDNGFDLYYIEVYDKYGKFLFKEDIFPIDGGGGGTPITNITNLSNSIIDGQFSFSKLGSSTISPIPSGTTDVQLIPSPAGFAGNVQMGGWSFFKNVTGATDSISTPQQSLSSTNPPSNPRRVFQYNCTVAGAGTRNDLLYGTVDVKSFSNQQITVVFNAEASGSAPIGIASDFIIVQNFGTGGAPTAEIITLIPFVWPTTFNTVTITTVVPSVSGMSLGTNNDDFMQIGVRFPIGATGTYKVTNFMRVLGNAAPPAYLYETQVETYYKLLASFVQSQINALIPVGHMMYSWSAVPSNGWIVLADGLDIGNAASGAFFASAIYQQLFIFFWNALPNAQAPVSGGRGATAIADFNANKKILPPSTTLRTLANVRGSSGIPPFVPGGTIGSLTHTLTIPELPTFSLGVPTVNPVIGPITVGFEAKTGTVTTPLLTTSIGSNTPHNIVQPTVFGYLHIFYGLQ